MASASRTITVAEVTEFGPPEVLKPAERPYPEPAEGELVVRIAAANVNPTDIGGRSGASHRRMPDLVPPFVLGWDLAGEVAELGPGVDRFKPGDPVLGMIPWGRIGGRVGAYAQAAAVQPEWLVPQPEGLDAITGATVPLNTLTATQRAVADGLRVLAVATDGDEEWVASLGPGEVLPRSTDLSTIGPVDALFDAVPIGAEATVAVKQGGVAVFTRGVQVRDRPDLRVETPLAHSDREALAELTNQVAAGKLRTRVARTIPLTEAAEAHRLVEQGGLRGKIVLRT